MPPVEQLERLAAAGIQLLPAFEITTHYVFARGDFAALVERTPAGFGGVGASGLLTEEGLAPLVWRSGEAFFVRKEFRVAAAPEQLLELRRFAADLERALKL